jgi:hypothetical protein
VFRGTRTDRDSLPTPASRSGDAGIAVDLTRRVDANEGIANALWLAPGATGLCILSLPKDAIAPAAVCGSYDDARTGHLAGSTTSGAGNVWVFGVVPDGATGVMLRFKDGTSRAAVVRDNAYDIHVTEPTSAVSLTLPDGRTTEVAVSSYGG